MRADDPPVIVQAIARLSARPILPQDDRLCSTQHRPPESASTGDAPAVSAKSPTWFSD